MALYADLATFKTYLRDTGAGVADDTLMTLCLDSASRVIDRACARTFDLTAVSATARVFTAYRGAQYPAYRGVNYPAYGITNYPIYNGNHYTVEIDDVTDTTGMLIKFDATGNSSFTTASTAYRVGPVNAVSKGRPYTQLVFDLGVAPPLANDSVQVTAKWGWTAVPTTIQNATLIEAARFLKRRESAFGIAGSPEMGNELRLLAKLDPDVALMTATYKKNWAVAA